MCIPKNGANDKIRLRWEMDMAELTLVQDWNHISYWDQMFSQKYQLGNINIKLKIISFFQVQHPSRVKTL